ncbi:MAG: putative metal-binding motif-containing protein [Phycisphaerales bacterium]|nr:MAG: putative metal-binding motif-containing protein [Phycisphaerales bacterium]
MKSSTTYTGQSRYGSRKTINLFLVLAVLGLPALWGLADDPSHEATPSKSDRTSSTSRLIAGGGDECTDVDGDGYGVGPDCLGPDCNDDDDAVNPGISEACDGVNAKCCNTVDDNCDGSIDENATAHARDGDPQSRCYVDDTPGDSCTVPADCPEGNCLPSSPTYLREIDLPLGAMCVNGLGVCAETGTVVCKVDGTGAECDAVPGLPEEGGEGLDDQGMPDPTVDSCFDKRDNDCDGLVDHGNPDEGRDTLCTTPELCDGFDNDNDGEIDNGFGLGDPCSVGVGLCADTGIVICNDSGGTTCTASPLPPSSETPPGSGACADEEDNDCDGLTDLSDPDCQEAEKCDGKDNDGDGGIDEDFADLGSPCTSGVGPCAASGVKVCNASQDGTACTAMPLPASPEGPLGETCTDGIDNDCDGMIDEGDPSCGASELTATCALPYLRGRPGADCTGWHRIVFSGGGSKNAQVTAELLGLDPDGNPIQSLAVENDHQAHLASRILEDDFKMVSRSNRKRTWHQVFAPIPILRLTVQDEFSTVHAFCSNIPFLQVIEPSGGSSSGSGGGIPVLVAIPLVDVATLSVMVDGVDIVAGLGLDPRAAFPGGPYGGTVEINGTMIEVADLIVDGGSIDEEHSNTLSMTLSDLGCGGHVVLVEAQPLSPPFKNTNGETVGGDGGEGVCDACHVDDLRDTGLQSVFTIEVTSPAEGEVVISEPVQVIGEVCHGSEIAAVNINGFDVDVSGQTVELGDGETSADTYRLDFDVMIPVTNLREAVDTGTTGGSFDPGTNRLVAQATDVDFNTTYDTFIFAVGPIVPAPSSLAAVTADGSSSEVQRAFTLAISTEGLNTFFDSLKDRNKRDIGDRVRDRIKKIRRRFKPNIPRSCDPWTTMVINNAAYECENDPNCDHLDRFSVEAVPEQDQIPVKINLPGIDKEAHFSGYCESDCFLGICAWCTTINLAAKFKRTGMFVSFDLKEERLLHRQKLDLNFDPGDSDNGTRLWGKVDIGCLLGFFLRVIEFFVQVITFGLVDLDLAEFEFVLTGDDMIGKFGGLDGDPLDLNLAEFKNDRLVNDFGMRMRRDPGGDTPLSDAQITPLGIAVSLPASFEPAGDLDPGAEEIPGTPLKNAPLPEPPIMDAAGRPAGHVTIAISDDLFNQLFYSMTQKGRLKTQFDDVRGLGGFLPEDCDAITDSVRRARCVGMRTGDCSEFPLLSEERRACRRARRIKRNHNIGTDTNLILNGQVDVPPVLLIDDDPECPDGAGPDDPCRTDKVELVLRYQNITFTLVADRDGNSLFDLGDLAITNQCDLNLDEDSATQSTAATECILWKLCMTIDVKLSMELTENPNSGRSRIKFNFEGIDRELSRGVLCDGAVDVPELDFFNRSSGRTETFNILENRLRDNTPPLDSEGVELGGFVSFQRDRVIAIETQSPAQDDGFQDYVGITGNIVPTP